MIRPSAVRHKKSTLNCFPVRKSVKGTCNWGTANPFSIMTARAKDSPPFSLLASVYLSNLKMREQSRVVRAHSCKICFSSIPSEAASSKIGREWTKSIVRPQSSSVREGFVTGIPLAITAFSLGYGLYMILSFSCGRYDPWLGSVMVSPCRCKIRGWSNPWAAAAVIPEKTQLGWRSLRALAMCNDCSDSLS